MLLTFIMNKLFVQKYLKMLRVSTKAEINRSFEQFRGVVNEKKNGANLMHKFTLILVCFLKCDILPIGPFSFQLNVFLF